MAARLATLIRVRSNIALNVRPFDSLIDFRSYSAIPKSWWGFADCCVVFELLTMINIPVRC